MNIVTGIPHLSCHFKRYLIIIQKFAIKIEKAKHCTQRNIQTIYKRSATFPKLPAIILRDTDKDVLERPIQITA